MQNSIFNLVSHSVDLGTQAMTTVGSVSWSTVYWQEGLHYQVFRAVSGSAGRPVVLTSESGSNGKAFLNGLQIVGSLP